MQKAWKTWIALTGTLVLALVLFGTGSDGGAVSSLTPLLGRLHPSLVHFPIGILLLAVLLYWLSSRPRFEALKPAVGPALLLGAAGAVGAVCAGLAQAAGGGYDAELIDWHKRLSIGLAFTALLSYALLPSAPAASTSRKRGFGTALILLAGLVAAGGHFGGSLTHGRDYLTRALPPSLLRLTGLDDAPAADHLLPDDPATVSAYSGLIQPIFTSRCTACHNPDKQKGGLLLDTPEGLTKGGDDGPAFTAGDPAGSPLIQRILLPPSHKEHMPPRGRPPLSAAQATLLSWWIEQGAPFDSPVTEMPLTPAVQLILDGYGLGHRPRGIFALDVHPADTLAFEALRATGIRVTPLSGDTPFLQILARNNAAVTDETLTLLTPLAPQIAWLDLAGTGVTGAGLQTLSALPHLTRLHLERTEIGDDGLEHLARLPYLEYLNLYGTRVTDAGLEILGDLPALRALYLWQTPVTPDAAERLRRTNPKLLVDLGVNTALQDLPSRP